MPRARTVPVDDVSGARVDDESRRRQRMPPLRPDRFDVLAAHAAEERLEADEADSVVSRALQRAEHLATHLTPGEQGDSPALARALAALRDAQLEAASLYERAERAFLAAELEAEQSGERERQLERVTRRRRPRWRRGKCASACAALVALCCLGLVLLCVLVASGYDGFTVNEVDYWYPVALCFHSLGGAQANYVGTEADSCGSVCAVDGSATPSRVTIEVGRRGYGGDAGFRLGAPYRLVLLGFADSLACTARLSTVRGVTLVEAGFDSRSCASTRRGLRAASHLNSTAAWIRRRLEGVRSGTWFTRMHSDDLSLARTRFGPDARWGGEVQPTVNGDVSCALGIVAAGTRVALQRSAPSMANSETEREQCDGMVRPLEWTAMRAELGEPFVLESSDFPLTLSIDGAVGILASRPGRAAALAALPPPELFFTFYTSEVNWGERYGLWLGLPLGVLLGLCCCCCCLSCLCPRRRESEAGPPEMRAARLDDCEVEVVRLSQKPVKL